MFYSFCFHGRDYFWKREFCLSLSPHAYHFPNVELSDSMETIITQVKDAGLFDNTIIIFASDNGARTSGGGINSPLRGQKGTFMDASVRVPAFIYGPSFGLTPKIYNK